jgi:hypothetical protein
MKKNLLTALFAMTVTISAVAGSSDKDPMVGGLMTGSDI